MIKKTQQKAPLKRLDGLRQNTAVQWIGLILLGIGSGLISMMLGASYFGMPMFWAYFSSPLLVMLNLFPPVLLCAFAYLITGRVWIGFFAASVIVLGLTVIDFLKIQVRSEPFVVSDFKLAGEAGKAMGGYALIINWKIYLAVAYILFGSVFSLIFFKRRLKPRTRIVGTAAVLAISALAYFTLYSSGRVYNAAKGDYDIDIWSNAENAIVRGFVYPFIYSVHDLAAGPPAGYKTEKAAAALAVYDSESIPDNQKINIVSVMLESYTDLSALGILDFNVDVYEPFHKLQQESVYGSLVANVFAGGTTDTERTFLTGFTAMGDVKSPTNSYVYYLRDQGYYTEGYHAGEKWYYDRINVNSNLGFDKYYFLEDFPAANRWDDSFFKKVTELYAARDKGTPYFSYNLSYQNHGPYNSESTGDTVYIERNGLSDASYNIINNYLTGVDNTTEHIIEFVDYFRNLDAPVILVLFGDHKPWLGNDNSVYDDLGINIDLSTADGFFNYYTTPYIIWANDAAKKVLGLDVIGYGGDISPCFLMNKVFSVCAWGGNAYMKAAGDLEKTTPIVNNATGYFQIDGALTQELSGAAEDVYSNFKLVEYYWQYNFMD